MELTQLSVVLFPLCFWYAFAPIRLLQLSLLFSTCGAAAAAVISGLGLPPGLPPAVLFLAFVGLQYTLGARFPGEAAVLRLLEPLIILVIYALLTSVVLPRAFAGKFEVWPQKVDHGFPFPITIGPTASNYTQDLYLLSNACVAIFGALFLTRSDVSPRALVHTYWWGAAFVAFVSVWQVASRLGGVFFPTAFFYSNPGWVIFEGQEFGSVLRTNGPFSEPASLAFYESGMIYSSAWVLLRGHASRMAMLLLPVSIGTLSLSTSTTGYAVLGAGAAFLLLYALTVAPKAEAARILKYGVPFGVLLVLGVLAAASLDSSFAKSVDEVVSQTLSKGKASSYEDRTSLDSDCIALLWPTAGLGAGYGSVRSSSLVPGLIANIGIPGIALVLWFAWRIFATVGRVRRLGGDADNLLAVDATSAAIVGTLVAAVISAPTISNVDFYLVLALLVGSLARMEVAVRHPAPRPQAATGWRTA